MKEHINPCICNVCLQARDNEIVRVREAQKKEIAGMLEGMRRKYLHQIVAQGSEEHLNDTWREGFNSALDDAITKIKG